MIPLQLTIEGLYSYQTRQSIDFSTLTEAGLFGIFGHVGSGKSSILEAITFALYGETERMNAREKRAYNMMNLKSNQSFIEFVFVNHVRETYKIQRTFKRNSKKFDDVKPTDTILYQLVNDQWIPLDHTDAEKIIGLSYTNFKRTIIIPQGQFQEFLELGVADRTKMMKEIFNLHRFDLQEKAAVLAKKTQSELDQLQGKLSGFEEISQEKISNLQSELLTKEKIADEVHERYHTINIQYQHLKVLKDDFEQLKLKKIDFESLQEQKLSIDKEEQQLQYYEKIVTAFQHLLHEEKNIQEELNNKIQSKQTHEKELQSIQESLQISTSQIEILQPQYDALASKKLEELDIENIIAIIKYQSEIKTLQQRTQNGKDELEKVKEVQIAVSEKIKEVEKEIQTLSEKRIDSQLLIQVGNWYTESENLSKTLQRHQTQIAALQTSIDEILQTLTELNVKREKYTEDYNNNIAELHVHKSNLQQEKSQLELQQKLAHYSDNLQEGEPCPLCGATEHPNPAILENVAPKIEDLQQQIMALEAKELNLRNQLSIVQNYIQRIEIFEEQISNEKKIAIEVEGSLQTHFEKFVWKEFDAQQPTIFHEKQKETLALEKKIKDKNLEITSLRDVLEKAIENVSKYEKALSDFQLSEKEKETQILQNIANLKVLDFQTYEKQSVEKLQDTLQSLKATYKKVEADYVASKENQKSLAIEESAKKATISQLSEDIKILQTKIATVQNQIKEQLLHHQIESLENVRETLTWNLNTSAIHEKIKNFHIQFHTLKHIIKDLESKFQKTPYDEELFAQQQEKFETISQELKNANDQVAQGKAEISRLQLAFKSKKDLLKSLEKIKARAENLKTLSNLFKGAGFVQFVSSIYLRQLCDLANVRFHRMTRNQLSLHLNENNDFEIIDYLNEGRSRSVKTLSGGQSFQVSLSLALALAESVQSNAKADKNFFFIDEGFGTQDLDSINIVFETLQRLQKENRIVGIISHVEQLKERIPISLQITKDEEKGSTIEVI